MPTTCCLFRVVFVITCLLLLLVLLAVYVDLKYNEIYLTSTAGYVCLCGMCNHVVVLGLSVRLSCYLCGGCGDCDACVVVCVGCDYAERVRG